MKNLELIKSIPQMNIDQVFNIVDQINSYWDHQEKIEKRKIKAAKIKKVTDAIVTSKEQFEIYVHYNNTSEIDIIPLEGCKNAILIFSEYKKIGHSMGLNFITLYAGDAKIKKIIFKY